MARIFNIFFLTILISNYSYSQESERSSNINILRPSKAAFYSAVIPGLGQIYNDKLWKVPLVYTALGISGYSYDFNRKKFWSYRNAYKRRKAGFSDDEFQGIIINDERLLDGQGYKDLSMVYLVGFYFLNILDANIDAHLLDYNVDENLSFKPFFENTDNMFGPSVGMKMKINF